MSGQERHCNDMSSTAPLGTNVPQILWGGQTIPATSLADTLTLWRETAGYNDTSGLESPCSVPRALACAVPAELTARILGGHETPQATPAFRAHLINSFHLLVLGCLTPIGKCSEFTRRNGEPLYWPLYTVARDADERLAIAQANHTPLPPVPHEDLAEEWIASAFIEAVFHRDRNERQRSRMMDAVRQVVDENILTAQARATIATAHATHVRGGGW